MKKILHISCILCLSFLLINCKKNNEKPAEEVAPAEETNTETVTTSTATSFDGFFNCGTIKKITGTTEVINSFATAFFSDTPNTFINPGTSVGVKSVYLNNELLPYDENLKGHISNTLSNSATTAWLVEGANAIPGFKYTDKTAYPNITTGTLPDSISKSTTFTLTVQVANSANAALFIHDGVNSQVNAFELVNGANTVTISSANMTPLAVGEKNAVIVLTAESKHAISTGGKNFKMGKELQVVKSIKIKG